MNDFFRKHGKWMLAILGVVLMIMWVMPTGASQGRHEKRTIGYVGKSKMTSDDLADADMDIKALRSIAQRSYERIIMMMMAQMEKDPRYAMIPPQQLYEYAKAVAPRTEYRKTSGFTIFGIIGTGQASAATGQMDNGLLSRQTDLHFALLLKEASTKGIVPSQERVQALVQGFLFDETTQGQVLTDMSLSPRRFAELISRFATIEQLIMTSTTAVYVSLPEVQHYLVDTESQVTAGYVALTTEKLPAGMPAPRKDEIDAQFAAYKDILPIASGKEPTEINGHTYPFAYKFPDRVKIEYLMVPYLEVRKTAQPQKTGERVNDEIEAFKEFQAHYTTDTVLPRAGSSLRSRHRTRHGHLRPGGVPGRTEVRLGHPGGPARIQAGRFHPPGCSRPAPPRAAEMQQAWTKVRDVYLDRQVDKRARSMVRDIAERAVAMGLAPWKESGENGYRKAIPQEQWASYATIAAQLTASDKVPVIAVKPTHLVTREQVGKLPNIGQAEYTRASQQKVSLADLAMHVYPLDAKQTGVPMQLLLQVGVDGPVLIDESNNAYVYRVAEAQASHAPATEAEMAEILPQVTADLQRLAYYKQLQQKGSALEVVATASGLKSAAAASSEKLALTSPFARSELSFDSAGQITFDYPAIDKTLGRIPEFTKAAFAIADTLTQPVSGALALPPGHLPERPRQGRQRR